MSVRSSRFVLTTLLALAALLASVVGAVAGGGGTAPPRLVLIARGDATNFADALVVGSVAAQLGAPVLTTIKDALPAETATELADYKPELVIVAGGPGSVTDGVMAEIATAASLPADKVIRAYGSGRYGTAVALANLLDEIEGVHYDKAFLPINGMAADADKLDGLDATAFARSGTACASGKVVTGFDATGQPVCATDTDTVDGGDAATLGGIAASGFLKTTDTIDADTLEGQSLAALDLRYLAAMANVVVVSADGTDSENGTALATAVAGITDASPTNPYLVLLGPGVFDLGASGLQMKDDVAVVGSGRDVTILTASGFASGPTTADGTVLGADAELAHLTVRNTGGAAYALGINAREVTGLRVRDVAVEVSGATTTNYGVAVWDGEAELDDVDIVMGDEGASVGLAVWTYTAAVDSTATVHDVSVRIPGTTNMHHHAVEVWGSTSGANTASLSGSGLDIEVTTGTGNIWGLDLQHKISVALSDVSIDVSGTSGNHNGVTVGANNTGTVDATIDGLDVSAPDYAIDVTGYAPHVLRVRDARLDSKVRVIDSSTSGGSDSKLYLSSVEITGAVSISGDGGGAGGYVCRDVFNSSFADIVCP